MIAAAFTVAACLVSGWFLARALTAGAFLGPRWSSLLVELSLGALFGPGLASILCLALLRAGAATPTGVITTVVTMLAACSAIWRKFTQAAPQPPAASKKFPWNWALWVCATAALGLFLLDFQAAAGANPYGEWDAMAIWNLRARFLSSGGDLWLRAVSSESVGGMAGVAHPGYPLFLPLFSRSHGSPQACFPPPFLSARACSSLWRRWAFWARASRHAERRFSESWLG
jgi:hypothetical protein